MIENDRMVIPRRVVAVGGDSKHETWELDSQYGIEVRKHPVEALGYGVFATKDFSDADTNPLWIPFAGRYVSDHKTEGSYVIAVSQSFVGDDDKMKTIHFVFNGDPNRPDGNRSRECHVASMVNEPMEGKQANCVIATINGMIFIRSVRPIANGDELTAYYGADYQRSYSIGTNCELTERQREHSMRIEESQLARIAELCHFGDFDKTSKVWVD